MPLNDNSLASNIFKYNTMSEKCTSYIDNCYKGPLVLENYFMKKKSNSAVFKGHIRRYFILDLQKLHFSYKKKFNSSKIKVGLPLLSIIKFSTAIDGWSPTGYPYGISIEWPVKKYILFTEKKEVLDSWTTALHSILSIPNKPIDFINSTAINVLTQPLVSEHSIEETKKTTNIRDIVQQIQPCETPILLEPKKEESKKANTVSSKYSLSDVSCLLYTSPSPRDS